MFFDAFDNYEITNVSYMQLLKILYATRNYGIDNASIVNLNLE